MMVRLFSRDAVAKSPCTCGSLPGIYKQLEPIFRHWEDQLDDGRSHINNPKIPVKFVRENGLKVYPINPQHPIDPDLINI